MSIFSEASSRNLAKRVIAKTECPPIIGIELKVPGAESTPVATAPI